jgi:hypothetical protein
LLENLIPKDWERKFIHSEAGEMTLAEYVKVTAVHGPKHLNSIKAVLS